MPHNLYLHSSISQTRKVDYKDPADIKRAVRFMTWDSNIELSLAFVVNSLLLILGAALFFGHGDKIGAFSSMYNALKDNHIAGAIASPFLSTLFAIALLASGQNSTITGTLTGQIVMEGFLRFRLPQWVVRLMTRIIALLPVIIVAILPSGLFSSLPISCSSFLYLPSGLFHLQQGNHGRACQCEMEYVLRLSRCNCLNHLKFQFDRDNFYQIKKPALQRCWFLFITQASPSCFFIS